MLQTHRYFLQFALTRGFEIEINNGVSKLKTRNYNEALTHINESIGPDGHVDGKAESVITVDTVNGDGCVVCTSLSAMSSGHPFNTITESVLDGVFEGWEKAYQTYIDMTNDFNKSPLRVRLASVLGKIESALDEYNQLDHQAKNIASEAFTGGLNVNGIYNKLDELLGSDMKHVIASMERHEDPERFNRQLDILNARFDPILYDLVLSKGHYFEQAIESLDYLDKNESLQLKEIILKNLEFSGMDRDRAVEEIDDQLDANENVNPGA